MSVCNSVSIGLIDSGLLQAIIEVDGFARITVVNNDDRSLGLGFGEGTIDSGRCLYTLCGWLFDRGLLPLHRSLSSTSLLWRNRFLGRFVQFLCLEFSSFLVVIAFVLFCRITGFPLTTRGLGEYGTSKAFASHVLFSPSVGGRCQPARKFLASSDGAIEVGGNGDVIVDGELLQALNDLGLLFLNIHASGHFVLQSSFTDGHVLSFLIAPALDLNASVDPCDSRRCDIVSLAVKAFEAEMLCL